MGFIVVKSNKYAYGLFDTATFQYKLYRLSDKTREVRDKLKDYLYTAAFVNREYGFYGLMKDKDGVLTVIIMTTEDAERNKNRILNIEDKNIVEIGLEIFEKEWARKIKGRVKCLVWKDNRYFPLGVEKFMQHIGAIEKQEETTEVVEQEVVEILEQEKETVEQVENENKHTIEELETVKHADSIESEDGDMSENAGQEIEKAMEKYYTTRKEKEELEKREAEANELANKAMKLINTVSSNSLDTIEDTILEIGDIITMNEEKDENKVVQSDFVYELMLKTIKKNDSISIPMKYFRKLKTTIRRNLFLNMSCTKYTALTDIKFNNTDKNNIFAVVEYDESLEDVRISVLKSFSSVRIEDSELVYYELNYNKWRKEHSYTNLA